MINSLRSEHNILNTLLLIGAVSVIGNFLAYKIVHIPVQLEAVLYFTLFAFYPLIRKPTIGIYLIFTVIPFIPFIRRLYYLRYLRPDIDPLIAVSDIIIMITMIGLFFIFRENREQHRSVRIINRIVLCYFGYMILRTFVVNILPLQEALMRMRFYAPTVLLFLIGSLFAMHTGLLKRIWVITITTGCLAALYGFKQLFIGYSEAEHLWFSSISFTTLFIKGLARPFSIFQSPASFADYMQFAIIGVLILSDKDKKIFRKGLLFLLPFYFYAALITSVRSNWVGILLSLILWLLILQIKSNTKRIALIITLGLLFITSQLLDFSIKYDVAINSLTSSITGTFNQQQLNLLVTERTSAISNPFEEYSLLSRISLWKYLITLSRYPPHALLGRGVGTLNADSLYFTYLAEFGYPGLIFILWFIIYSIQKGFKLIDSTAPREIVSIAKGITLMNLVLAVVNITGTHIHSFPGDVYFWFWNGVLFKLCAEYGTTRSTIRKAVALPDIKQSSFI